MFRSYTQESQVFGTLKDEFDFMTQSSSELVNAGGKELKHGASASPLHRQLRELLNVVLIVLGVFSAALGLHGFLLSNKFIDGGVTGVSMLLANITGLSLSVLLPIFNLPFIAMGYRHIGLRFAIRSTFAICLLAVVLATIHFPDVTQDRLLSAVFGGFFIGAGIGLAIRGGAVLDGTEIAALLISKKSHLLKVGDVILGINVVIFFVAIFVLGTEEALYSMSPLQKLSTSSSMESNNTQPS